MLRKAREYIFVRETVRVCAACVKRPVANGGKREKGRGWQFGGGRRKKQARREEEEREREGEEEEEGPPTKTGQESKPPFCCPLV